jgi:predicted ATPase/DNA-binding XRE family transcriptional regulator
MTDTKPTQSTAIFVQWLKQRRTALGLTQSSLAEQVFCSESLIRKFELGKRTPTRQMAESLAQTLKVPANQQADFIQLAVFGHKPPPKPTSYPTPTAGWLPHPPTSLLGRITELHNVRRYLQPGRLLTLLGAPGVGKTRLAIEVATQQRNQFADGTWFVDLTDLRTADAVAPAIAQSIGLQVLAKQTVAAGLRQHLAERCVLLVLDNCEHVLDSAPLLADLLMHCPQLAILATSREALRIRAEQRFGVSPLALPTPSLNDITQSPAVQLFVERAQSLDPHFAVTPDNQALLAHICQCLDGLPLAIELAAAQLDQLSLNELARNLHTQMAYSTFRDLPPRQQSLQAAIAWSYNQLSATEQRVFMLLSGFVGGWSAALLAQLGACYEQVSGLSLGDLESIVQRLIDKHLVQAYTVAGKVQRFRLLEALREFAQAQVPDQERSVLADAHCQSYCMLSERHGVFADLSEANWLDSLANERGNIQAALTWAEQHAPALGLQMASALMRFWHTRGHLREGLTWIQRLLTQLTPQLHNSKIHADALYSDAFLSSQLGDTTAMVRGKQALMLYRQANDDFGIAKTLTMLGMLARYPGNHQYVQPLFDESLRRFQALNNTDRIGTVLNQLGMLQLEIGAFQAAEMHFSEALNLANQKARLDAQARLLPNLGFAQFYQGKHTQAKHTFTKAQKIAQLCDDQEMEAEALRGMAYLAWPETPTCHNMLQESRAIVVKLGLTFRQAQLDADLTLLAALDRQHNVATQLKQNLELSCSGLWLACIVQNLYGLAWHHLQQHHLKHAHRFFGVAKGFTERFSIGLIPHVRYLYDQLQQRLSSGGDAPLWQEVSAATKVNLPTISFPSAYEALQQLHLFEIIANMTEQIEERKEKELGR